MRYVDPHGGMIRRYTLQYFHADGSIEIVDEARDAKFFPRAMYAAVTAEDLQIGKTIVVWRRRLLLERYGDAFTRQRYARLASVLPVA